MKQTSQPIQLRPCNNQISSVFSRKKIFKTNETASKVNLKNSIIMFQHDGDHIQPNDELEFTARSISYGKQNTGEMDKVKGVKRKLFEWGISEDNSEEEGEGEEDWRMKNGINQRGLINYPAIQVRNRETPTFSNSKTKIKQQKFWSLKQSEKCGVKKQSLALEGLEIQNQMLKSQRILLKQVLQSNTKKLTNLKEMQNLQKSNLEYQNKIKQARKIVLQWSSFDPRNQILAQLLQNLTF